MLIAKHLYVFLCFPAYFRCFLAFYCIFQGFSVKKWFPAFLVTKIMDSLSNYFLIVFIFISISNYLGIQAYFFTFDL